MAASKIDEKNTLRRGHLICPEHLVAVNVKNEELVKLAKQKLNGDDELINPKNYIINPIIYLPILEFYLDITQNQKEDLFEENAQYENSEIFFNDFAKLYDVYIFISKSQQELALIIGYQFNEDNYLVYSLGSHELVINTDDLAKRYQIVSLPKNLDIPLLIPKPQIQ